MDFTRPFGVGKRRRAAFDHRQHQFGGQIARVVARGTDQFGLCRELAHGQNACWSDVGKYCVCC